MKKTFDYLALTAILLLIGLSVFAAFLGAARAQVFFNSIPLTVYWLVSVILIFATIISFKKIRKPALFLIHIGIILIILGSILASEKGHILRSKLFGVVKPQKSQMTIYQEQSSNELYEEKQNQRCRLPFEIRLNKFIVENYPSYLTIRLSNKILKAPVDVGSEFAVNDVISKIKIVRTFENFKITFDGNGNMIPIDSNKPGRNPAVELEITKNDGTVSRHFVYELFKGHTQADEQYHITYHRPIKDFISKVDIIENGEVIKSGNIEVNHPLHFAGFHFYQNSYDDKRHQYTVLEVVSDTGLNIVYIGFACLSLGIFLYFWFVEARRIWK